MVLKTVNLQEERSVPLSIVDALNSSTPLFTLFFYTFLLTFFFGRVAVENPLKMKKSVKSDALNQWWCIAVRISASNLEDRFANPSTHSWVWVTHGKSVFASLKIAIRQQIKKRYRISANRSRSLVIKINRVLTTHLQKRWLLWDPTFISSMLFENFLHDICGRYCAAFVLLLNWDWDEHNYEMSNHQADLKIHKKLK